MPREGTALFSERLPKGEWIIEVLRRFLTFLINNIILVGIGAFIASKVARFCGLTFDYKRRIEELVELFEQLIAWL